MAVIKANAYGVGAEKVCNAIDADYFAVARISEAIALKKKFPSKEFVVLSGGLSKAELEVALEYDLVIVIHSPFQLELLETIGSNQLIKCWLKYDSGMHRLGLNDGDIEWILETLLSIDEVEIKGILSHLSSADTDLQTCQQQISRLIKISNNKKLPISMTNSAGLLRELPINQHVARFGLALYGISPFAEDMEINLKLKQAYNFSAKVISIRKHEANESVGYNQTWISKSKTRIAVVGVGYADGYPRSITEGTPVLINQQRYPIVGLVSMDLLSVEIGLDSNISIGDEVILWGDNLPIELIAKLSNRIPYELLTGISSRVNRKYL
jgi:alanine racemase